MFKEFLESDEQFMYITGAGGTGKTYSLRQMVQETPKDYKICFSVFTHKACGVVFENVKDLIDYPEVRTLHSLLNIKPLKDQDALTISDVEFDYVSDSEQEYDLVFIDEFSMINRIMLDALKEKPYKVVFLGDPYQLPPVQDKQAVEPNGDWHKHLTKNYRQQDNKELLNAVNAVRSFCEGVKPYRVEGFNRNVDIVDCYKNSIVEEKILLAYTNARVRALNISIAGKENLEVGDRCVVTQFNSYFEILALDIQPTRIIDTQGRYLINDKYNVVKRLSRLGYKFARLKKGNKIIECAYVESYVAHKDTIDRFKQEAVSVNKQINILYKCTNISTWARENKDTTLGQDYKKAWAEFLLVSQYLLCIDFPYATTVHKSQGSTYKEVYIDGKDLYKCAKHNYPLYLRLYYVAVSRASDAVYINT